MKLEESKLEDTSSKSERIARLAAQVLDESKMEDIRIVQVGDALQITDYFIVASGRNPRHVKAASDEVMRRLRDAGAVRRGLEGHREGKWVLLDFADIVVHLFVEDSRRFYDLENLWGDCPRLDWSPERRPLSAGT